MVTKPLLMGLISAVIFGGAIAGLKVFVFVRTGDFSRMDLMEMVIWTAIAFIWPYFIQARK